DKAKVDRLISYAMLDFGFKAKRLDERHYWLRGYAMLDFGFKAKQDFRLPCCSCRYAMLDFGFKAKRCFKCFHIIFLILFLKL
ncbi:hypothetical protein, partial [uncultured Akkermansia sp.]|uniref:hypothetical protein n=1 Tax=uncultured Akkermansia sp. TaxID=512294 RepID=UPI0025886F25